MLVLTRFGTGPTTLSTCTSERGERLRFQLGQLIKFCLSCKLTVQCCVVGWQVNLSIAQIIEHVAKVRPVAIDKVARRCTIGIRLPTDQTRKECLWDA